MLCSRSIGLINGAMSRYIRTSSYLKDYYKVLGANKGDSAKDIKKKFRKLAKEHHPDTSESGDTQKFQEINEAWEVLKDEEQRKTYDQLGHDNYKSFKQTGGSYDASSAGQNPFGGMGGMDINDLFSDMFGGGFGGRRQRQTGRQRTKGQDLSLRLELTFEEAVKGAKKSFQYSRVDKCADCKGSGVFDNETADEETCEECKGQGVVHRMVGNNMFTEQRCSACQGQGRKLKNPCKACTGTGQVQKRTDIEDFKIPPGVDTGTVFHKPNGGNAGLYGGEFGDLVIQVSVRPDQTGKFTRDGLDLLSFVEVDLVKSLLGGIAEVRSVTDEVMEVKIAPGTLHGKLLRLPKRGVQYGSQKGDLLLRVRVKPVSSLTERQKELLEEFDLEEQKKKQSQSGKEKI